MPIKELCRNAALSDAAIKAKPANRTVVGTTLSSEERSRTPEVNFGYSHRVDLNDSTSSFAIPKPSSPNESPLNNMKRSSPRRNTHG